MSCGFDKGLIAALYDGETTETERAEAERHLASCPECARDLASMKEMSAALKPLARAAAPLSIADGVIREIGATRRAPRPWVQWSLTAAAAVFLAVGTVTLLDRATAPKSLEPMARVEEPKASPARRTASEFTRSENRAKDDDHLEKEATPSDRKEAPRVGGERAKKLAPPPPPPAMPPPAPFADEPPAPAAEFPAKKMEQDHLGGRGAAKSDKPTVPVVRVTGADVAVARGEVEAFLKERELKANPGAPLLGRSAYVRDHYLQLELTDEEVQALEKRLAALKAIALARGTLEAEKKRVTEELAKQKDTSKAALEVPKPAEADRESKDADEAPAEEKAERARGLATPPSADPVAVRKKIIFVFEPAPKK